MRGKRKIAENWEFDGNTITVRIPMTRKCHGGRKVIIAPDGCDPWAPAEPRPDETLIRALARAHRWKQMLEEGKYRSAAEIAAAEGVTCSFINRLLRLTLLTPDIVEAVLDGRQSKGLQLAELTTAAPSAWEEQRQRLLAKIGAGLPDSGSRRASANASRSRPCAGQRKSDHGERTKLANRDRFRVPTSCPAKLPG